MDSLAYHLDTTNDIFWQQLASSCLETKCCVSVPVQQTAWKRVLKIPLFSLLAKKNYMPFRRLIIHFPIHDNLSVSLITYYMNLLRTIFIHFRRV